MDRPRPMGWSSLPLQRPGVWHPSSPTQAPPAGFQNRRAAGSPWRAPVGCAPGVFDLRGRGRPLRRACGARGEGVQGVFGRVAIGRYGPALPARRGASRRGSPTAESHRSRAGASVAGRQPRSRNFPCQHPFRSKRLAAPRVNGMRDASDRLLPSHVSYEYPRFVGSRCVTREGLRIRGDRLLHGGRIRFGGPHAVDAAGAWPVLRVRA